MSSVDKCIKVYGLGNGCDYEILSVEKIWIDENSEKLYNYSVKKRKEILTRNADDIWYLYVSSW